MENTLITLANLSFDLGLIGIDEYSERIEVALWLADDGETAKDPRFKESEKRRKNQREENFEINTIIPNTGNDLNWLEFLFNKTWYFTKSDPDFYPSIPHGHFKNKNNKWPKLNPYTGRVFKSKHQEDPSEKLTKKEMKKIWSDEKFRSFCRDHIVWYLENFQNYRFPVKRPLRLPRW